MKFSFGLLFVIGMFSISACSDKNVEEDFPSEPCVTMSATFSGEVLPLIRQYCYSCHDTDTRFGGVYLEGYANVASYANAGILMDALRGTNGVSLMPIDGITMLPCDIETIEQWISEGAQNN